MPDQIYKRVLLVFLIIIKSVKEKKKEITYLIAYIKNKKKTKKQTTPSFIFNITIL